MTTDYGPSLVALGVVYIVTPLVLRLIFSCRPHRVSLLGISLRTTNLRSSKGPYSRSAVESAIAVTNEELASGLYVEQCHSNVWLLKGCRMPGQSPEWRLHGPISLFIVAPLMRWTEDTGEVAIEYRMMWDIPCAILGSVFATVGLIGTESLQTLYLYWFLSVVFASAFAAWYYLTAVKELVFILSTNLNATESYSTDQLST